MKGTTMRYLLPILIAVVALPTAPVAQELAPTAGQHDTGQERWRAQPDEKREQNQTIRGDVTHRNSLGRFRVDGHQLTFTNRANGDGVAPAGARYRTRWMVYSHTMDEYVTFTTATVSARPVATFPDITLGIDQHLVAEIRTSHDEDPAWNAPVEVHLRSTNGQLTLVGIARTTTAATVKAN